jgi:hypothetical protein
VFEGLSVLDELPGELGLVLWQTLRDCMLWGRSRRPSAPLSSRRRPNPRASPPC